MRRGALNNGLMKTDNYKLAESFYVRGASKVILWCLLKHVKFFNFLCLFLGRCLFKLAT
jgi:hypothetical protein